MTDYRSDAERFVTAFIDYVEEHDIKDYFDTKMNKMERSPGVENLVKQAKAVFPERIGLEGTKDLSTTEVSEAIEASDGVVIDRREDFARRVQANGGVRKMLRSLFNGEPDAHDRVAEFFAAEDGEKPFVG